MMVVPLHGSTGAGDAIGLGGGGVDSSRSSILNGVRLIALLPVFGPKTSPNMSKWRHGTMFSPVFVISARPGVVPGWSGVTLARPGVVPGWSGVMLAHPGVGPGRAGVT